MPPSWNRQPLGGPVSDHAETLCGTEIGRYHSSRLFGGDGGELGSIFDTVQLVGCADVEDDPRQVGYLLLGQSIATGRRLWLDGDHFASGCRHVAAVSCGRSLVVLARIRRGTTTAKVSGQARRMECYQEQGGYHHTTGQPRFIPILIEKDE